MWLAGVHVTGSLNQFWVMEFEELQTREQEGQSHSSLLEPTQGHHVPQMLDTELWSLMLALLA